MRLIFSEHAWEDYLHWQRADRRLLASINRLIQEIQRSPYEGAGHPEPLRHALSGFWSRRISEEHRLVYRLEGDAILIVQARYHY